MEARAMPCDRRGADQCAQRTQKKDGIMNLKMFTLAGSAAAMIGGAVSADFVGVQTMQRPITDPGGQGVVFGVYAVFNNPADAVLGVADPAYEGLRAPLQNLVPGADTFAFNDYDSFVTVGTPVFNGTSLTPGWGTDVVKGMSWSNIGEAYFFAGAGVPAGDNSDGIDGAVLIASFAFDAETTYDVEFYYDGELNVVVGGSTESYLFATFFDPYFPAPGALSMLAVAGMAGGRRRRA
jgi:hypothetical protein